MTDRLNKRVCATRGWIKRATVLCWWGGSRPSAYVGIVGLRVWTLTGEVGTSIPRGSRPSNRVGIVETYNYNHEIVLLA